LSREFQNTSGGSSKATNTRADTSRRRCHRCFFFLLGHSYLSDLRIIIAVLATSPSPQLFNAPGTSQVPPNGGLRVLKIVELRIVASNRRRCSPKGRDSRSDGVWRGGFHCSASGTFGPSLSSRRRWVMFKKLGLLGLILGTALTLTVAGAWSGSETARVPEISKRQGVVKSADYPHSTRPAPL